MKKLIMLLTIALLFTSCLAGGQCRKMKKYRPYSQTTTVQHNLVKDC